MFNYVVTYFLGGIILNLAGPIASDIRKEMHCLRALEKRSDVRRRLLLSEIMLRAVLLCLYPIAYTMWFVDKYHRHKGVPTASDRKRHMKVRMEIQKERDERKQDLIASRTFVYFQDTHGGGAIRCHGCGFRQDIVSFSHGMEDMHPFARGYQCQKCGNIRKIQFLGGRFVTSFLRCACGGKLSNSKPIFCPKCKARDVYYILEYVT